MIKNWFITFIVPVIAVVFGLLIRLPFQKNRASESKLMQEYLNSVYHRYQWQFGLVLLALAFMLMRSTRLMSSTVQMVLAIVWLCVELLLLYFIRIPVTRQMDDNIIVSENANAKINLTLEIGYPGNDGYHQVNTIMSEIDLCDRIVIQKTEDREIRLTSNAADLPNNSDNLAYRAAQSFFETLGITSPGIQIELIKRIPSQAGMGGGSSDAAAVLRGLRRMFSPDLSDEELETIGAKLGSDVPFFIRGGTIYCNGHGEKIVQTLPNPKCYYVIAKPVEANPTGKMYSLLDEINPERKKTTDAMIKALQERDLTAICANLYNTFEAVIPETSEIPQLRNALKEHGAIGAMMTGSGSAVFGIYPDEDTADAAYQGLKNTCQQLYLCKSPER